MSCLLLLIPLWVIEVILEPSGTLSKPTWLGPETNLKTFPQTQIPGAPGRKEFYPFFDILMINFYLGQGKTYKKFHKTKNIGNHERKRSWLDKSIQIMPHFWVMMSFELPIFCPKFLFTWCFQNFSNFSIRFFF